MTLIPKIELLNRRCGESEHIKYLLLIIWDVNELGNKFKEGAQGGITNLAFYLLICQWICFSKKFITLIIWCRTKFLPFKLHNGHKYKTSLAD